MLPFLSAKSYKRTEKMTGIEAFKNKRWRKIILKRKRNELKKTGK